MEYVELIQIKLTRNIRLFKTYFLTLFERKTTMFALGDEEFAPEIRYLRSIKAKKFI